MERFALAQEAESQQRREMLDDLRFRAGEQWPDKIKAVRELDINGTRPCLVLDKIGQYCRQVSNDVRQNLPSIRVRPVDDKSDKDTAEVLNGLIRHVEDVSSADIAYLTALDWAVTCGLGYFRILTEYTSDDSWDQDIRIARIHNPFAVYYDPHSTTPDGSDAEWCFITEDVPRTAFEKQYPKAEKGGDLGPVSEGDRVHTWFSEDTIKVGEYFRIERVKDEVVLLADQSSLYGSRIKELLEGGAEVPQVVRSRPVDRRVCRWQKITGSEVLEESEFPSSYIPVIPVIGAEFWIDGKRQLSGLVRPAKDPQRALNYWCSVATEVSALTPRAPFIGASGQFENFETEWGTANTENHAFLQYNAISLGGSLAPPPQRQPFPGAPTGMLAMMQMFEGHIQSAVGMYQASVGAPSNEKSGIAIRERKNEGDVGTAHFRGNLSFSMRHAARILMEMLPRVMDTARIARIIGEDGAVDTVALDPNLPAASQKTPKDQPNLHNITIGRYDVSVDIGPAYATRRQDAAEGMTEMVRAFPPLIQTHGDLMFRNMDWPGAEQFADRSKKALPPQLADDEEGDQQIPPQVKMQIQQGMQQYEQQIAMLQQQLQQASTAAQEGQAAAKDKGAEHGLKSMEIQVKQAEIEIKRFEAQSKRLEVQMKASEGQARVDNVEAQTAQIQAPNEILAGLIEASQGMGQTIAALAQAAQGMNAPKRIELVRDAHGRAAGAVMVPEVG